MEASDLPADYGARVSAMAGAARSAAPRVRAARGEAASRDGAVTAVVGGNGTLESLSFGPTAAGLAPDVLSAAVRDTVSQARERAARAAMDAVDAQLAGSSGTAPSEDGGFTRG